MPNELSADDGIEVVTNEPEPQIPVLSDEQPADEPEKEEEAPPVEPVVEPQDTEPVEPPTTTQPEESPVTTELETTQGTAEPLPDDETIDTEPVTLESMQKAMTKLQNRYGYLQRQIEKGAVPSDTQIVQKEVTPVTVTEDKPKAVPDFNDPKPKEDDFENFDEYNEALLDWKVDKKLAEQKAEAEAAKNEVREKELETEFRTKLAEGEEKYADFGESISDPTVPMHAGIVNLLRETDNPADVAYYLSKNRKECATISQMTSNRAAIAIGKIDARFEANPVKKLPFNSSDIKDVNGIEEPEKKKQSIPEAPAPITPIGSRETVTKDPDKMTQAEYEAYRTAQKKAKGI